MERLHKRIAASGIASRRAAEKLIAEGRVEVNGEIITEMGFKVGQDDEIRVDSRRLEPTKLHYLAMNKPDGYLTTLKDPQGRPTVAALLPKLGVTLKPVGRLDMDTEGLLIFTNDGEFANRLAHPRYEIEKEYIAVVRGKPDEKALAKLRKGIFVEGRKTTPAKVYIDSDAGQDQSRLKLILHEGRKRQVRLMCEAVGYPVRSLKRVRIGPVRLGQLRKGECRMLSAFELASLRAELRLP